MGTTDRAWPKTGVLLATLGLYLATFALFAFPWLRRMRDVMPSYPFRQDEEFIVWALAWVAHALSDAGARVFDANIFHPAPDQLTGSEYLFTFQPLFAPLYLLTGEPLLATGIVTFVTYPLAAFAMAALLIRMGCSPLVAWLAGLTYALGILRVPLNFHTLQYPNLFLPLLALAVVQTRDAPGWKTALWTFLFLLAALLTSFYLAVIACVALSLWVVGEVLVSRRGIGTFLAGVALPLLAAGLVAALLLSPYTARSESMLPDRLPWDHSEDLRGWTWLAITYWRINCDTWRIAFVPLVLLGFGWRGELAWRRLAIIGGGLCIVSVLLVTVGLPAGVSELAAQTPLRNLRGWVRLLLITDFAVCLLAAVGLDLCRRRFGMRIALLPIVAFALLTAFPRLMSLASDMTPYPVARGERADAYRGVKRHADEGGRGSLLELPPGANDRESMFASTFHWLPLISGLSGYSPPHARAVRAAADALPAPAALQELVDLTHLRWILLRPDRDWARPQMAQRMRRGLARFKMVGPAIPIGGFTLYRVTARPLRRHWYSAIAAGPRPGLTALGTPVRRLSLEEASASVSLLGDAPVDAGPGPVSLRLKVRNSGTVDWPVLVGSDAGNFGSSAWMLHPFTVYLEARWVRLSKSAAAEPDEDLVYNMILNRDVESREALTQEFSIPRPPAAGRYLLELCVAQKDGPRFGEPPSRVLRLEIELGPAGPEEIPEVADQFF